MRTTIHRYFVLLISLCVIYSCSDDKILDNPRSDLFGVWEVDSEIYDTLNDTLIQRRFPYAIISFFEDGTGRQVLTFLNEADDFEWIYQSEPEKIVLNIERVFQQDSVPLNLIFSETFDILESEELSMVWEIDFNISLPIYANARRRLLFTKN